MAVEEDSMLYFAYGSNMHLKQMAQRCPSSQLAGTAILRGYRWQINQRGVANVVPSADACVEGVLFRINDRDRRILDRYEGYGKVYDRRELIVEACLAHPNIESKKLSALSKRFEKGQDLNSITEEYERQDDKEELRLESKFRGTSFGEMMLTDPNKPQPPPPIRHSFQNSSPNSGHVQIQQVRGSQDCQVTGSPDQNRTATCQTKNGASTKALVYLSETFAVDGSIRDEYIERMRNAMSDAVNAGVSQHFVQQTLEPLVSGVQRGDSDRHTPATGARVEQIQVEELRDHSGRSSPGSSIHSSNGKRDIRRIQSARVSTFSDIEDERVMETISGGHSDGDVSPRAAEAGRRKKRRNGSHSMRTVDESERQPQISWLSRAVGTFMKGYSSTPRM